MNGYLCEELDACTRIYATDEIDDFRAICIGAPNGLIPRYVDVFPFLFKLLRCPWGPYISDGSLVSEVAIASRALTAMRRNPFRWERRLGYSPGRQEGE